MTRGEADTGFWVNTVSRSHVERGVREGVVQSNHDKATGVRQLRRGDLVVFYSPRTDYPDGELLQQFTACGVVTGTEAYQVEVSPQFHPWRRDVAFAPCLPAPIRPLLPHLGFVLDGSNWGFTFRRGLFEVPAEDFDRIVAAMGATSLLPTGDRLATPA